MPIDQLIAELQRFKEEGVSGDTKVYLNPTKSDSLLIDVLIKEDKTLWIELCN